MMLICLWSWIKLECKKENIPWNKGLTKEVDPRIKSYADKLTGRKLSEEHRESLRGARPDVVLWNKGLTVEDERVARYVEGSSRYMKERGANPENHWNYQGGITKEEYGPDWTDELKERIRSRDGACMCCGISSEDCEAWHGEKLIVHHVDGVKKNCNEKNLVCLCRYCHASVHNTLTSLPNLIGMWNR